MEALQRRCRRCARIRTTPRRARTFDAHVADLGYGAAAEALHADDAAKADAGSRSTRRPGHRAAVPPLFWTFRIMVGLGFYFIALFATVFLLSARARCERHRWFLRLACL